MNHDVSVFQSYYSINALVLVIVVIYDAIIRGVYKIRFVKTVEMNITGTLTSDKLPINCPKDPGVYASRFSRANNYLLEKIRKKTNSKVNYRTFYLNKSINRKFWALLKSFFCKFSCWRMTYSCWRIVCALRMREKTGTGLWLVLSFQLFHCDRKKVGNCDYFLFCFTSKFSLYIVVK